MCGKGLCACLCPVCAYVLFYMPQQWKKVRLGENEPTDAVLDPCKVVMLFRHPDGFAFND